MTAFEELVQHGVLVRPSFIEPDVCRRLRQAASAARADRATITKQTGEVLLDERTRRTRRAIVPEECEQLVEQRLIAISGQLAGYFGVKVAAVQRPQFLVYGRGDFFLAHQDSVVDRQAGDEIRLRRVSLVIFLNSQSRLPEPDSFCGGALTFLRLMAAATVDNGRMPVPGQEGMLVAFRSDLPHEVRPVIHGERHTVVSWLMGPDVEELA